MGTPRPPLYKWLGGNTGGSIAFWGILGGLYVTKVVTKSTPKAFAFAFVAAAVVFGGYFLSKTLARRRAGVVAPFGLSDRIAALAAALRGRADGLEDRFGRKPAEHHELAQEEWNDLKRIADLRGMRPVAEAVERMASGDPAELRGRADALQQLATTLRGTKTPYHMDRTQLVQAITCVALLATCGGLLLRYNARSREHYERLAREGTTVEATVVGQSSDRVGTTNYYHRVVEYSVGGALRRLTERARSTGSYEMAKGMKVDVVYPPGRESEAMLLDDVVRLADQQRGPAYYFGIGLLVCACLAGIVFGLMQIERN